jgi:hypothetical protein
VVEELMVYLDQMHKDPQELLIQEEEQEVIVQIVHLVHN